MLDSEAREREDVTLAWHRPHVDQKISRHGLPADRGGRFARPAFRDRAGPHTSSSRWPLVLVATSCSHVSPWSRYRRAWRWKQPELAGQARAIELAISLACLQFDQLLPAAPPRGQGKGHPRYRRPNWLDMLGLDRWTSSRAPSHLGRICLPDSNLQAEDLLASAVLGQVRIRWASWPNAGMQLLSSPFINRKKFALLLNYYKNLIFNF